MENLPIYPYRSIGSFFEGNQAFLYSIDKNNYLLSPAKRNYKILSLPDMKIKFLSPTFEEEIKFAFAYNEFVTLTQQKKLIKMKYSHKVKEYEFSKDFLDIISLGKYLLILFDDNSMVLFHCGKFEIEETYTLDRKTKRIFHPITYLNKILCYSENNLFLFNFNSGLEIFNYIDQEEFQSLFQNDEIQQVQGSTIPDVVALVMKSGSIVGFNLKTLEIYFKFQSQEQITSLVFTQNTEDHPLLIASTELGNIFIYDLNKKVFTTSLKIYSNSINQLISYVSGNEEHLLVLSSQSNAIFQYLRDEQEQSQFRILRKRQGALFPYSKISLYKDRFLIGLTSYEKGEMLRISIYNDSATVPFSKKVQEKHKYLQTELTKKTSKIEDFSLSQLNDESGKSNLFTRHQNSPYPLFWDAENVSIKKLFLELNNEYQMNQDKSYEKKMKKFRSCTSLGVSICSNFLFIGYEDGLITKISTQRGMYNSSFKCSLLDNNLPIDSIHCDNLNNHLIVTQKNTLYKLDFFSGSILDQQKLEQNVKQIFYNSNLGLIGLQTNSRTLEILSSINLSQLRSIDLNGEEINDLKFSEKKQKCLIATKSGKFQIWDLFLGKKISELQLEKSILSFDFNEATNQLFSVFENEREVYLWNILNLGLCLNETKKVKFCSHIEKEITNPKLYYLLQNHVQENLINELTDIDLALIQEAEKIINQDPQMNKTKNKMEIDQDIKWRQLIHIDNIELQNKLQNKDFQENKVDDLPFFLDFGDNVLNKMKEEHEGTIEKQKKKSRRVIREYNREEIIQERGSVIDKLLDQINEIEYRKQIKIKGNKTQQKNYENLLISTQNLSAQEIDLYFKTAVLNEKNVIKILSFCHFISLQKHNYNFCVSLIYSLINSIYDKIEHHKKEGMSYFKSIGENLKIKTENFIEHYIEIIGIVENITSKLAFQ